MYSAKLSSIDQLRGAAFSHCMCLSFLRLRDRLNWHATYKSETTYAVDYSTLDNRQLVVRNDNIQRQPLTLNALTIGG